MKYRKLSNSDLEVSVITFGAWAAGGWMWGSTERSEAVNAIRSAYDEGVTSIDTAPIYGQGTSEEIVGEAISTLPREKVQVLTKFGMRWDLQKGEFGFKSKDNDGNDIDIYKYSAAESIIKECENSLRRLKTDYIDLYQIHWADSTTPISESFEAVDKLVQQGKVRFAGVCNYSTSQIREAEKATTIVSNQIPFSMVSRGIEEEIVPFCIDHGTSILAYSPLERGLLTGKITPGYKFQTGDHRAQHKHFTPEFIQKTNALLDKFKPIAEGHNITLAQLVLNWTIHRAGITIALAGARNAKQSIQNAGAAKFELSGSELDFISTEVEAFNSGT